MIKGHHEGYIGWAEYQRKLKGLTLNNYGRAGDVKSDRGGKALLSGIMTWGRCGRRRHGKSADPTGLSAGQAKPYDTNHAARTLSRNFSTSSLR
jgi:hypothetical protein